MILKQRFNNCGGRPLTELATDFENIIEHVFGDQPSSCEWMPRTNIEESDSGYVIGLELPGVDHDAVNVVLQDGELIVSGEKQIADADEGVTRIKSERQSGSFKRSFKFATQLDSDRISASFQNGVLKIELPKSEKVLPRKIKISVGAVGE